ncbi:MAG: hypothetical protein A2283_09940 [Lentisphaerae bacterium RIFOXYA12_FULL_48_11]|nr:MAG: hypothetical protein A2283_09940 [Lentisphaerae bacterium RIFOXYA12_FULL_48_11]
MDLLTHAMYGATVCSRAGLAGGRKGSGKRHWFKDSTVWWAVLFGLGPDIVSMWIPLAMHTLSGNEENFFYLFDGNWLVVYRLSHSLIMAAVVSSVLFLCRSLLFVPSLAWTVHVVMDAVSHGTGKFQTLLFYPFSRWGVDGVNWWQAPWVLQVACVSLPLIWLALMLWRRVPDSSGIARVPGKSQK